MKVICYALCFVLLVFPLAACQVNSTSDSFASDASSISDTPNVVDAEFSVIDGTHNQTIVMGKVISIDGYTVTIETMGFGSPRQADRENMPELPEGVDSSMPEMSEKPNIPDKQEAGEDPKMSRGNLPDAENMMEAPEKGGLSFEKEDSGENRDFDLENAKIFIEYPDGMISSSIDDIEVDSVLGIELDEEDNVISVIILSDFKSFTENSVPPMDEKKENSSDKE